MHCSPVSSGASQAYAMHAAQGRKAAGCGEAKPVKSSEACGESRGCDDAPRAARAEGRPARNPLVAAMMEALKGLVPSSASAAAPATSETADATEAGTAASAAKDQAKALKEAAYGFAHELFQALKAVGASGADASGEAGGCRPHRCGGYGKPSGGASAYGGLAEALQKLAQGMARAPATSAATPATPATSAATTAADTTPPVAGTPPASAPVAAAPAKPAEFATVKTPAPTATSNGITINLTLDFGAAAQTGSADASTAASSDSPLLAAFKKLMLALNPKAGSDEAATPGVADAETQKKPAEMLQAFLQQMAKALGADGSTGLDALPAKGSLINLSA